MDGTAAGMGGMFLVLTVLAIVLVICWIILPFAIIGTKPLLRQILAEQRKTNELLALRRGAAASTGADVRREPT